MTRKSRTKSTFSEELYETLLVAPVWAGPLLAVLAFTALRWLIPWAFSPSNSKDLMAKKMFGTLSGASVKAAPWGTSVLIVIWLFALIGKWSNRQRVDQQTGMESIRRLSWRDFERLLAEAFRRQGFVVEQMGGAGPDGGIDLRLRRQAEVVLVQCKQWRKWNVGVKIVREMYGVVAAERATRGIVVTSGKFSPDAIEFARSVPMTLIDGDEILRLIAEVQTTPLIVEPTQLEGSTPQCPTCGVLMTLRTAKQGTRAGSQFWGCSNYPACRGTRQLSPVRV